jgi:chromosome segregation ATPase
MEPQPAAPQNSPLRSITAEIDRFIEVRTVPLFPDILKFETRAESLASRLEANSARLHADARAVSSVFLLSARSVAHASVLTDFLSALTAELSHVASAGSSLSSDQAVVESRIGSSSALLAEVREDIAACDSQLAALAVELRELRASSLAAADSLTRAQGQWDALDRETAAVAAEISGAKSEVTGQISRQSASRVQLSSLDTLLHALADEIECLETEISALEQTRATRETELKAHILREAGDAADHAMLRDGEAVAVKSNAELTEEISAVRAALEALENERGNVAVAMVNARNATEELTAGLEEQQAIADGVMVMQHKLESDRDELGKQADAVKLELQASQAELDALEHELKELREREQEMKAFPIQQRARIRRRNPAVSSQTPQLPSRLFPDFSIAQSTIE